MSLLCRAVVRPLAVVALLMMAWTVASAPARAQEVRPVALAVLDVQRVMSESKAVQTLSGQLEERQVQYQAELRDKEAELRNADQELARQRSILSADAFAQKRKELQEQFAAMQREAQARKRGQERAFGRGMTQVQRALGDIAKDIAAERGLDLILSKAAAVIVKPELDITEEAIARLNERLPELPAPAAEN